MKTLLLALLMLWVAPASAQTYFGVLTSTPNTGPGASCCSGAAYVDQSSAAVPSDCVGCSVITTAQFNAFQSAVAAIAPATANSLLLTGVTVTFAVSTAASGTYAADPATIAAMSAQLAHFSATGVFIGATALIQVKDTTGTNHSMSSATFKVLFGILQDYAAHVATAQATAKTNNTAPTWPSATVSSPS